MSWLAHSQLCVGESLSDVHVPRSHAFVEYVSVQKKGSPCLAFIYVMTSAGVTSEDRSRSQMLKQRRGVAASFMAPGICVCVCVHRDERHTLRTAEVMCSSWLQEKLFKKQINISLDHLGRFLLISHSRLKNIFLTVYCFCVTYCYNTAAFHPDFLKCFIFTAHKKQWLLFPALLAAHLLMYLWFRGVLKAATHL